MEGMSGCITNYGQLIDAGKYGKYLAIALSNSKEVMYSHHYGLRLAAPKDQKVWVSALSFRDIDAVVLRLKTQCVIDEVVRYTGDYREVLAYRITGLAEGYTDDPAKAGV